MLGLHSMAEGQDMSTSLKKMIKSRNLEIGILGKMISGSISGSVSSWTPLSKRAVNTSPIIYTHPQFFVLVPHVVRFLL